MKLSTINKKLSNYSHWLWFLGLYCLSFIVVGSLITLTHWLGKVLIKII
ncbi:MAG TPA: hypothetical protein PKD00_08625 [Burkholderiales bacterium]|nr:hypothetical protein [Burkholderiales bacterium]